MRKRCNFSPIIFCLCLFVSLAAFQCRANADEEAPNRPYVKASEYGSVYAKCIPGDILGEAGKTKIYRINEKDEALLCSFDWYPDSIYLVDSFNDNSPCLIVRIGPWPRGNEPNDKELAIAFYNNCKEVKRYSTADIVRSCFDDPLNIRRTVSHYTVFKKIKGFRTLEYDKYAFDIITQEGKTISFDVATGKLRTARDEENQKKKDKEYYEAQCKGWKGKLTHSVDEEGRDVWSCEIPSGVLP